MYPQAKAHALISRWEEIEKMPKEHAIRLDSEDSIFNCDLELHNFFTFLKLLPAHKVKFVTATKSFIVFCEVIESFILQNKVDNYLFTNHRIQLLTQCSFETRKITFHI